MNDEELAIYVATKMLVAKTADREEVLRSEIPMDRLGRMPPLNPIAMARVFDGLTTNSKLRLGMEVVMRLASRGRAVASRSRST